MIRAFIAVTPPIVLQQSFTEVRVAFEKYALPFRWVRPEHIHLTLRFLGDTAPEALPSVVQAMRRAVMGQAPFTILASGLGCFPGPSRPRVLWMGLHDPQGALLSLQQRLEAELVALGFAAEERPFHPHLTLARAQHSTGRHPLAPLLHAYQARQFGEIAVEQLHLLQSQLRREGAEYTMLHSVSLQG